jgi:outer membrane protein TolC
MRHIVFAWSLALLILAISGMGLGAESLTVQQAVDIALRQNPDLRAAGNETDAARAGERGARALANPEILVAPTVVGTAGADSAVSVVQPLEVNGQRAVRSRIARFETSATQASYRVVANDLVRSVKQTYWDVAQAANFVELNRDNVTTADALHEAALRQRDVGAAPGAHVIKSGVELARARQELSLAESQLSQAKARLNTLLGRPPETAFALADPLLFTPLVVDEARLRTNAAANRPELAEAQASLCAREAEVRAVEVRRRPDLALQARQETFGGDAGVAIGVTLPLLDWGSVQADREKAEDKAIAQSRRVESVRNAVSLDVESALREVSRTEALIKEYEQGVVSQAEQLARMAQKGFEAGASSYLEVLEAQRTLKAVRTEYYAALADHQKAIAQLEWATGTPVTRQEVGK